MTPDFRFVIVGTGHISKTYVAAVGRLPGMRIAACVSRSGRRPPGLDGSIETAPTLAGVRTPFDAVILCTPNGLHHEAAAEAAAMGRHVLTEKPLDVTLAAMDRMIAACRSAGVKLGVAYQRRMSHDNRALKRLLDAGALGRVYAADVVVKYFREQEAYYDSAAWRGTWAVDGGGPFIQQASHHIDLYAWMFGMPAEIVCRTGTLAHSIEVEDHGAAILTHPDGMIGTIVASTVAKPGFPPRFEVHAGKGSVVLVNDLITAWEVDGVPNPSVPPDRPIHNGMTVAVSDTSSHEAILRDFVAAVRTGREPEVTGESARLTGELILRIYEAARRKG